MEEGKPRSRFLDLSEYVLKEFSPLTRPIPSDIKHIERVITFHELTTLTPIYLQTHNIQNPPLQRNTPQIAPIDHDPSTIKITPFLNGLISVADQQLQEFNLDSNQLLQQESRQRDKAKPDWSLSRRRANSLVLMNLQQELEDISEESEHYFHSVESVSEQQESEESASEHQSQKLTEMNLARMRTQSEYRARIQKYVRQPQHTLVKQIRRIQNALSLSQQSRLMQIKQLLLGYLVQFQLPCFEEAWDQIMSVPDKIDIICKGVQQNLARKIGELTFDTRRVKLLKYLQKKKMRRWRKKVGYDCRKKVADGRLRIKGKFVTRQQVCEQLGIKNIEVYTGDEIKQLLERKREQKSLSQ